MTEQNYDDEFDDGDGVPWDDEVEDRFDCGLDPESGQCALAGSEDCDWECPNRDSEFFAGSRRYCKKHKQLFYSQVDLARHALGLDQNHKEAYRNHYTVPEEAKEYAEWMEMVSMGLAIRVDRRNMMGGNWLFHLTREGAEQALYEGEELGSGEYPKAKS